MTPHPAPLRYRPDIDGMRAVAVAAVVGFHYFPTMAPGGFAGVDVFFVISGFLITAIIQADLQADRFRFTHFYARRIRRIFPALLAVASACLLTGWLLLIPDEFARLGKHLSAAATFVANLSYWQEAGYFDTASARKPLLHLWSLGIEEQFYIVWPLAAWLLFRRGFGLLRPVLMLGAASFAVSLVMSARDPAGNFYSPFSRAWELAAGAALACTPSDVSRSRAVAATLCVAGLIMMVATFFGIDPRANFPRPWTLLPVLGAASIIAAGQETWINRAVIGSRPLVALGRISYPLYLWHWPLLAFACILDNGTGSPPRSVRILLLLLSLCLAWATTKFLEPPYRFRRDRRSLFQLCAACAGLLAVGIACWSGMVAPRLDDGSLAQVMPATRDWQYPPADFRDITLDGHALIAKGDGARKTLYFGDSHMRQYAPRIDRLLDEGRKANVALFLTEGSCSPVPAGPASQDCLRQRRAFADIARRPEIDTVVLAAKWDAYAGDAQYLANLAALLEPLSRKRIFLVLDNPSGRAFDPRNMVFGSRLSSLTYKPATRYVPLPVAQRTLNEALAAVARHAGAMVIDPMAALCAGAQCLAATAGGGPLYRDDNHLRASFVRREAGFMDATLEPVR
jgi:peptidoglycan/LPS O-acetylase OafA/YrhL